MEKENKNTRQVPTSRDPATKEGEEKCGNRPAKGKKKKKKAKNPKLAIFFGNGKLSVHGTMAVVSGLLPEIYY